MPVCSRHTPLRSLLSLELAAIVAGCPIIDSGRLMVDGASKPRPAGYGCHGGLRPGPPLFALGSAVMGTRHTPYAEGCMYCPAKDHCTHCSMCHRHPLSTARLGSSGSSGAAKPALVCVTQTSAATLPPLPALTMLLETIQVTGASAVATFALSRAVQLLRL